MKQDWSTSEDIRGQLKRKWECGQILACSLHGESLFPMRIPLKHPAAGVIGDRFEEVRRWIATLSAQCKSTTGSGFRLEWHESSHRQLGKNRLPVAAVIETEADGLDIIGKRRQAEEFRKLADATIHVFPKLRSWLHKKPLKLLKHAPDWLQLLVVLAWISKHPRPGVYLRQLDLPGIHTKFIESHKSLLIELLDIVLPGDAIDFDASGVRGFEQRYGFRSKPTQIRLRLLERGTALQGLSDLAVPAIELARLKLPITTVFITENEINGLAFPCIKESIVIFGLGYGLQILKQVEWLGDKAIYYWGDIDTHGFVMLDQIRQYFPDTNSLLMDRETLLAHRQFWGNESKPTSRELGNLRPHESELYKEIVSNEYGKNLRLEQERIGFGWLQVALSNFEQID
ncbi:MAG: hypothetical protein GY785_11370 [Gammaproteobacteria bacterium]|nr:hypothetical protein [Gammaproteobacteria bacterium]